MRIFTRIFISHIIVGLISIVCLSIASYFLFQNALVQRTIDQLFSINILKRHRIEEYLLTTQKSLEHQAIVSYTPDLPGKLKDAFDFKSVLVIDSHGQKIGSAGGDSLLVALAGDIIRHHRRLDQFHILEANTFIPVRNTVLVYALPTQVANRPAFLLVEDNFEKIQTILLEITGMGSTGESYLVGGDLRMRSMSRFFPVQPPHSIPVNTAPVKSALAGTSRGEIALDYRGIKVLSVYHKLEAHDLDWVILSEMDYDEATEPLKRWISNLVIAAAIIMLLIVAVTWLIARSISKPVLALKPIITSLSMGVIPANKAHTGGTDEVGQITQAIDEWIEGVKRAARFADETGSGNFHANFKTLSDEDTLGMALVRMRDRLRKLTTEQISVEREKASALLEGQEKERKRIVLELHDGVGQLLTAIRLRLEAMKADEKTVSEISTLVNETIEEVKRISYNLMPNAIVDFGLEAALKGLCDTVQKSSGLSIDFQFVREVDHKLSFETSIAVFRIIQEAMNNVVKHASATQCHLHIVDNEDQLYVLVRDNGHGFDEATLSHQGIGLRSMKERATLLHGTLDVHSSPGNGTEIEVTIPMPKD